MKTPYLTSPGRKQKATILAAIALAVCVNILEFSLIPIFGQGMDHIRPDLGRPVLVADSEFSVRETKQAQPEQAQPEQAQPEQAQPEQIQSEHALPEPALPDLTVPDSARMLPALEKPAVSPFVPCGLPHPDVYDIADVDDAPCGVFAPRPRYPFRARQRGIEGKVVVEFLVDEKGRTSDIRVIDADPAGIFEGAVTRAVATWKFSAGRLGKRAVKTRMRIPVDFRLAD